MFVCIAAFQNMQQGFSSCVKYKQQWWTTLCSVCYRMDWLLCISQPKRTGSVQQKYWPNMTATWISKQRCKHALTHMQVDVKETIHSQKLDRWYKLLPKSDTYCFSEALYIPIIQGVRYLWQFVVIALSGHISPKKGFTWVITLHLITPSKWISLHLLLYTSARIYSSDCGLSLWKCQDGELPITARCQRQRQNQGRLQKSKIWWI